MEGRGILHVDMDAFYASVEQRDHPELKGKPVVVGGHPTRGVVLAASYEVRPYGVRSAMPMSQALRACPKMIVVPPRFSAYSQISEHVHGIFHRFTPLVEPLSLDEAFLDVTGSVGLFGPPAAQAAAIRKAIADELKLPSSAGIAPVKFAAKLATDLAKPNGQLEVTVAGMAAFLHPLPVTRLWGVGPKLAETLRKLGLRTIGEVAAADPHLLRSTLGSTGDELHRLAHGEDLREVVPDRAAKQVGAEETFGEDLSTLEQLAPHLLEQSLRVGRRLRRSGTKGSGVTLKIKFADFEVISRSTQLPHPTDDEHQLYHAALELLARVPLNKRIRLSGVSASGLVDAGKEGQLDLFSPAADRKRAALNHSLDAINQRFGANSVTLGTLLNRKGRS